MEITHLYANLLTNSLGKTLLIGFSQVATAPEVRDYYLRGVAIADKSLDLFSKQLRDTDLPTPLPRMRKSPTPASRPLPTNS